MKKKFKLGFIFIALLSFTLTMIFGLTNPARNTYAAWSGSGAGTSADPYQIGTLDELNKFRDIVNGENGETQNVSACAKLTADIVASPGYSDYWAPIASSTNPYNGVFDGNGHSIRVNISTSGSSHAGFFRCLGKDGVVKDLTIDGRIFYTGGQQYAGGIAAYSYGEITRCVTTIYEKNVDYDGSGVEATGAYGQYAGGIVGYMNNQYGTAKVTQCHNDSVVQSTANTRDGYAGGIAGFADGIISDCYSTRAISACADYGNNNYCGGIAGYQNANAQIIRCFSYGNVVVTRSNNTIGGVIGAANASAGTTENNYYLSGTLKFDDTVIDDGGINKADVVGKAEKMTADQFTDKTNFTGYDFNDVWKTIDQYIHPVLKFENIVVNFRVGNNFYDNIKTAAYNCPDGGTIILLSDFTLESNIDADIWDDITVDLNGHIFARKDYYNTLWRYGGGTLVVDNSKPETGGLSGGIGYNDWGESPITFKHCRLPFSLSEFQTMKDENQVALATGYAIYNINEDGTADENGFKTIIEEKRLEGKGTVESPYLITNANDLNKFRDIVNGLNEETKNNSACAKLTADIDLEGSNTNQWIPISDFRGTFDGDGHTISGLFISTNQGHVALFGSVTGTACIKNLTVEGSVTNIFNSPSSRDAGAAGIVAQATQNAYSGTVVIENCVNKVTVSGNSNSVSSAGIIAWGNKSVKIKDCVNDAPVTGNYCGGILAETASSPIDISYCYNTVNGTVGGRTTAGIASDFSGTMTNCYNAASVTGSHSVAGLVAYASSVTITNCYNLGVIDGSSGYYDSQYTGGIVGNFSSGTNAVSNCYNYGNVIRTSNSGSLVGRNNATVTSSYALTGTHTNLVGTNSEAVSDSKFISAAEFKAEGTFVDWEFGSVWEMNENYPTLLPYEEHSFTYTADGATITAVCSVDGCSITKGLTLTLVAPENLSYTGHSKTITFASGYSKTAFPNATIKYYKDDQEVPSCIDEGTYGAQVTFGNATAQIEFTITPHTHDGVDFTAWTSTNSLPTTAGNYFLTSNVTISSTWNVPSGTTNLCLNGYGIIKTGSSRVITLNGATLYLHDCNTTTEHKYTISSPVQGAGLAVVDDNATGGDVKTFVGGYITGANTSDKGAVISIEGGSTFVLNGGTLIGNKTSAGHGGGAVAMLGSSNKFIMNGGAIIGNMTTAGWGGGVYMHDGASFTMNGGVIKENYASKSGQGAGGAINAEGGGSFTMTGGEIINNVADNHGGNINYSCGSVKLSGDITITGGKKSSGANDNIYINGNRTLNIIGALDENSSICFTTSTTVITSGWSTYMANEHPDNYFVSDTTGQYLGLKDGEAALFNAPQRVRIGGNTYSTLQEAHNACNDNDVIVLMQDYERETEFGKLECDKTITIDLNGFIIKDFDYTVHSISANHDLTIDNSNPGIGGIKVLLSITSDRVLGKIILKNVRIDADKEMMENAGKSFIHFADGFNIFDFSPSSPDYAEGFMGIIMEYSQLDPDGKPTVTNPDHTPVYIGEEITIDVDGAPIEIKWYYVDGDGKPTGDPIGTGKTYTPKSPDDLGKKVIAVIKQHYDENGDPITGAIPTQMSDPIEIFTPFDKDEVIEIIVPGTNPKAGDVLEVSPSFKPSTVKWYYDDNEDGKPDDPSKPIGEGTTYTVVCPDPNDENHDDTGHTIIAVISQNVDENGDPITGDIPTITTNGVRVYTPLNPEEHPSITTPNHEPLYGGDEISMDTKATEVTIKWFYDDNGDGEPDGTTPIGEGKTYTIKNPEDLGHTIIAEIIQNKKDDGTDYPEGEKPVQHSQPVQVYTSITDDEEIVIKAEGDKKYPEAGDELTVDTNVTPITVKWYYDDDLDGEPDNPTTPIGTGDKYTVKDEDKGHNIIGVITQDKKPDGTDYEDNKPTTTTKPVEIYKELDTQSKPDITIPGNKNNPATGDEISVNPDCLPATVTWYYDDDFDGEEDEQEPLGTGNSYTVKDEDKGHNIIGVITQDKKPDGTDYEDNKPTTTTKPVQVYNPLNPDEEVVVKTTDDKERPGNGDEITIDPMLTPVSVNWYYDDDLDGQPDDPTTPIGTGKTYTVTEPQDTGHNIIGVITQDKKPDGTDYTDDEKPTTTTKPIKTHGYLPNEYVPLDEDDTPAPTVPNKKLLEDGDEITLETDATDVIIEWFYDDDNSGYPDTTTPIGTGKTYTLKCPDENDPTHDDRGHNIIAVISQKYDENGDLYPVDERPTQTSTTITNIKPLHEHNFTYTASGATITAKCENEDCDITEGLTLTLVAPTGSMVYDGNARVATIKSGYNEDVFVNPTIKYYFGARLLEVTECINAGEYTAKVEFGNAVASITFTIENWKPQTDVKPSSDIKEKEADLDVNVEIEGSEVKENISVKIEVKTTLTAQENGKNYDKIKTNLAKDETITRVYEVRLIRTVNGVEEEIQPSAIKEGTSIIVSMKLPDSITGQFKILHVHAPDDVEFITNYTMNGRIVSFKVSRLSEFAFIVKTDIKGFPAWGIALIVIDSILVLIAMAYLAIFFIFNKWIVVNGKAVRVLKCGKSEGKVRTITYVLSIEYVDESQVFNSKEEVLSFINK